MLKQKLTALLVSATCVFLSLGATTAQARSSSQYWIEGGGWGHGIGMSQYGANGYAQNGLTGEKIIEHYYSGTVVAAQPVDSPQTVRVLLRNDLPSARVLMTSAGVLQQGIAQIDLIPGDIVTFTANQSLLTATRTRGVETTPVISGASIDATILPSTDGGLKTLFSSDHARVNTAFRGSITAHLNKGLLGVVNTVPLEDYLRGVVPDEMPPSWHPEALKAQTIAARSYALTGLVSNSWFDLYSDTRSQVYGGITAEEASTDTAIAATSGMVARVGDANGSVARTFFFSTSPGRTAANEDVWGSTPYTYLRSVVSPFEKSSPYYQWRGTDLQRLTPSQLATKLGGYTGKFIGITQTLHPSGYADSIVVKGTTGSATFTGSQIQASMKLRSSYFKISLVSIAAPTSARSGTYVKIGGRAPITGITNVTLTSNGRIGKPIRLKVSKSGLWSIKAKANAPITARMSRAGVLGPAIKVDVL